MIQEFQIRVLPVVASSEQNIISYIADEKGIDARTVNAVRVLKRSIDARQRTIFINLTVRVYINEIPQDAEYVHTEYGDVSQKPQVVVVGEGPGGLFASLRLIELGLRPVVLERGKDVRQRKVDLANITKTQTVDPESNYCFGEGAPAPTPTANSTLARRSAAASRRFSTCSASTEPLRLSSSTPIRISAPTSCRRLSRRCVTPSYAAAARFTSKPR